MDSSFKNISSSDKHETQIDQLDEEEELGCQSLNWIGPDDAGSKPGKFEKIGVLTWSYKLNPGMEQRVF